MREIIQWVTLGILLMILFAQIVYTVITLLQDTEEWRDQRWRQKQMYKESPKMTRKRFRNIYSMYDSKGLKINGKRQVLNRGSR